MSTSGRLLKSKIPEQWQVPALLRLKQSIQSERVAHILLMIIAVIAAIPVGMATGALTGMLFPLLAEGLSDSLGIGGWLQEMLAPLGVGLSVASYLLMMGGGLITPILIIVGAIVAYNNQRRFALRDLLWGQAALVLIDDAYAQQIEEAVRARYRPRIIPIEPGTTFIERVNYFAHYNLYFRQLAHGQRDIRIPMTVGRNCWFDGTVTCLSSVCSAIVCLSILLLIPMIFRVTVMWSRHLAIKQAVFEYFMGLHEQELADAADRQAVQPRPTAGGDG